MGGIWKYLISAGVAILFVSVLFIPELGILTPYKTRSDNFPLPITDTKYGLIQRGVLVCEIEMVDKVEFRGMAFQTLDFYITHYQYLEEVHTGGAFPRELTLNSVKDFTIGFTPSYQPSDDVFGAHRWLFVFDNSINPQPNTINYHYKIMFKYNLFFYVWIVLMLIGIVLSALGVYKKKRNPKISV